MSWDQGQNQTAVIEDVDVDVKIKRPERFKVILHNDDLTTMEFVVRILRTIFGKTLDQAHEVMMVIHTVGSAVCGIYTKEISETKVQQVYIMSKKEGHPLKCTMESE